MPISVPNEPVVGISKCGHYIFEMEPIYDLKEISNGLDLFLTSYGIMKLES